MSCKPGLIASPTAPLPESVWEGLETLPSCAVQARVLGPPVLISGTEFFEYFLPLMAILGDIIDLHHRRNHPRFKDMDHSEVVSAVSGMLADCHSSLSALTNAVNDGTLQRVMSHGSHHTTASPNCDPSPSTTYSISETAATRRRIVVAYSTHVIHVLHVLLHGKWDPIAMLDNEDYWIATPQFSECASHAIAASEAVAEILRHDPELTFMPYLFGIYLLHGSFILLLFADRMEQLGSNPSVATACETLIRAHEVCVVTLSTEFQRSFRKVLRSTLYNVQGLGNGLQGCHGQRSQYRGLELYRWDRTGRGLAL